MLKAVTCPADERPQWRRQARRLAELSSWNHFFANYLEAFTLALKKAAVRRTTMPGTRP